MDSLRRQMDKVIAYVTTLQESGTVFRPFAPVNPDRIYSKTMDLEQFMYINTKLLTNWQKDKKHTNHIQEERDKTGTPQLRAWQSDLLVYLFKKQTNEQFTG
ncbi:hypothetical protein PoB_001019000 [Plakobranchus ocellatus]|uniref:Uncharacterized protein n=1 Tax=Plakobranchus ocellatus TaxID=259542 RepID=A0AAV3YLS7_9GAST|nr:hypothetical protein PoB_001019000 [Plakobranchus ocellatus]